MTTRAYTIDDITMPDSMADDKFGEYAEMIAVRNEIETGIMGPTP